MHTPAIAECNILLLSLDRYLCCRTISPRGYHPPSSYGLLDIFIIEILQFLHDVIIIKASSLSDIGDLILFHPFFVFLLPQTWLPSVLT